MNTTVLKKAVSGFLLLSLVVSSSVSPIYAETNEETSDSGSAAPTQASAPAEKTDQIIVKLKKPLTKSTLGGYEVVENKVGDDQSLVSVEVPAKESTETTVDKIDSRSDVEYAEPDYMMDLNSVSNDPYLSEQWHQKAIHSDEAWNVTRGSANVIVAVIDDGIDPEHPDLANQMIAPYDIVHNTNQSIQVGEHGTHVAGIIAAAANNGQGGSGVAPNVKIMPVNVFSVDDSGDEGAYTSDIIKGIYYAIDQGAKIINLSLGSYQNSTALNDAIQDAYKSGVIVIAAAGNDHSSQNTYPAAYDHVISVASTNSSDQASGFSNFGNSIDIAAPGENIFSTIPLDESSPPYGPYGFMSGTSMASPVVSGVAALIWSAHPSFTADQVINNLLDSADDLGAVGKDQIYGWGRVNAARAVGMKILPKPVVNPVSDRDHIITGKAPAEVISGQVIVQTTSGMIGKADIGSDHTFSIKNLPLQKAGTVLTVQIVDTEGNRSMPLSVKVIDRTPPKLSKVYTVSNLDTTVKGVSEAHSKIVIKKGSKVIGTGITGSNQQFAVKIPRQRETSKLSIVAVDSSNNQSAAIFMTVIDKAPPQKPAVHSVTYRSTHVTGKTEAYATVIVKHGKYKLGQAKANSKGYFSVKINRQKRGYYLNVSASDRSKNISFSKVKVR